MQVTSTSKKMPKQSRWLIVLPLMIWFMSAFFYFQQYFLRTSLSSLGDNLMASFMVTPETISNLATVFYAVFVIMQFFVGITIDKCGVRICLSLAAIVCGIGAFVFGFAAAVWMLYLGRILMGAGAAYALVGTLTLASWWFSERLFVLINGVTFTLGILGAFFAEGPFASVLEYMNWYIVMVVTGVICVVLGLLIFFLLPRRAAYQTQPEKSEDRHTWRDIKTIFDSGQFWLLCIFLGLTYVGLEMYSGLWCQPFLMAKYHFSEDLAGNISAMAFIGYAVGNLVVGAVIAKNIVDP